MCFSINTDCIIIFVLRIAWTIYISINHNISSCKSIIGYRIFTNVDMGCSINGCIFWTSIDIIHNRSTGYVDCCRAYYIISSNVSSKSSTIKLSVDDRVSFNIDSCISCNTFVLVSTIDVLRRCIFNVDGCICSFSTITSSTLVSSKDIGYGCSILCHTGIGYTCVISSTKYIGYGSRV